MSVSAVDGVGVHGEPRSYSREWKAYARRRNVALTLLAGGLPFSVGAYLVSDRWLGLVAVGIGAIAVWWVGSGVAVWWAGEFRCPRCLRRFGAVGSGLGLWRGLFEDGCSNCKLRRWEGG